MSRGVLYVIAGIILAGSLFLPWHYSVEERLLMRSELPPDYVLGCWHTRTLSIIGCHTPIAVMTIIPLAVIFLSFGILFVMRPNLDSYPTRLGPAIVVAIGAVAIAWFIFELDYPDIGPTIALIISMCAIPISFIRNKINPNHRLQHTARQARGR